ncbi:hypothetical protein BZA77DRAFT_108316 [Pyronema omphalodes]|nr:hypothetical protein BZA77DRAFT_108316 [Pyronema omphalodes]
MAAEVARSPSQTTAGGGNGVGVGVSSSTFHFNSPSSSITRPSSASVSTSSPQGTQQQYPSKPQQYKPNSPSPEAPFFSHHPSQRMSPTNPHLQLANNHPERTVPRALPPMSSPDRMAPNDPRLPVSPGDTSMGDGQDMLGDPTAPRKRSKVSRACDECRRKKVRNSGNFSAQWLLWGWDLSRRRRRLVRSFVVARRCLFSASRNDLRMSHMLFVHKSRSCSS